MKSKRLRTGDSHTALNGAEVGRGRGAQGGFQNTARSGGAGLTPLGSGLKMSTAFNRRVMKKSFGLPAPRRDFLKLSAAAIAITALPSRLLKAAESAPASRAKRNLKKAIMWGTVGVKGSVQEKMQLV